MLHEIPFNSVDKWAYCVARDPGDPTQFIAMLKVGLIKRGGGLISNSVDKWAYCVAGDPGDASHFIA